MSLINDMLKDLDNKERGKPSQLRFSDPSFLRRRFFSSSAWLKVLWGIIGINLIIAGSLLWYKTQFANGVVKPLKKVNQHHKQLESKLPIFNKTALVAKDINAVGDKFYASQQQKSFFIKKFKPLTLRQKSKQQYKQALALLNNNQYPQAKLKLSAIIEADPNFEPAIEVLIGMLIEAQQITEAHQLTDKSLQRFPQNLQFVEVKAELLLREGEVQQALNLLRSNMPAHISKAPDYFNLMAVAFEKLNQLDKSGAIYQQLVQLRADKSAYWLGLALSLEASRQFNQAIGAYTRVIEGADATPVMVSYARNKIASLRG